MTQQLFEMINRMGGADAVAAMAARVGVSPDQANSAVAALLPMLAGGMAKATATNPAAVDEAAGAAAALTGSAASDEAASLGQNILGQIFGGADVTHAVTQNAAAKTGLDAGTLAALLPMVATLAASTLGNTAAARGAMPAGAGGGGLGGLLGGLLGQGGTAAGAGGVGGLLMWMLDQNKDGNPLDDIMNMLQKR